MSNEKMIAQRQRLLAGLGLVALGFAGFAHALRTQTVIRQGLALMGLDLGEDPTMQKVLVEVARRVVEEWR